jgi:hypothetical protein
MALSKEGHIRLVQVVDNDGNVTTITANVENVKEGGNAFLTMTPALPGAGAFSTSAEINMAPAGSPKKDTVITVFADQPFEVYVEESIITAGTFRRTAMIAAGMASELRVIQLDWHGRDFAKVVIKNIGTAAMTTLEVTHKRWEF